MGERGPTPGWSTVGLGTVLVALVLPAGATAHAVYVDKETGSGTACTQAFPCALIAEGIAAADADSIVVVDDSPAPYLESLTLGDGKSLFAGEFVDGPEGPTIIDGGAGDGITVSGSAAGTIQGFRLRGDQRAVAVLTGVTIIDNTFDDPEESAFADVQVLASGTVVVSGNTFTDSASGSIDNAVGIAGSSPTIVGNQISGYDFGVNVSSDGTSPTIQGNTISGTEADSVLASGIRISIDATATVIGNVIQASAGGTRGISIEEEPATPLLNTGATLRRNRVLGFLNGVEVQNTTGAVSLEGDLIANSSTAGIQTLDGGTLGADDADVSATNVTLANNATDIVNTDADLTLDSSIVEDAIAATGTATCAITFSRGPTSGPGCSDFLTSDPPGFVGAGDFHLASGSAMIDAGNPSPPAVATDLDGDPRLADGNADGIAVRDIGADELVPLPPPGPEPEPEAGDSSPPDTVIDSGPSGRTKSKSASFTFHSTEAGSVFECKLDGGSFEPCGLPKSYHKLRRGSHSFEVRASDTANNDDPTPATRTWTVKKKKKK